MLQAIIDYFPDPYDFEQCACKIAQIMDSNIIQISTTRRTRDGGKDANGKYWFLGYEEFVSATAGTAETGVNRTDGNRYTITLTDYSSSYPYEVDPSIVDALVA